MKTTLTGKNY